jgi:hypothetical protein
LRRFSTAPDKGYECAQIVRRFDQWQFPFPVDPKSIQGLGAPGPKFAS